MSENERSFSECITKGRGVGRSPETPKPNIIPPGQKSGKKTDENIVLPCPFCGSNELVVTIGMEDSEGVPVSLQCDNCGCCGPWEYAQCPTQYADVQTACKTTGWNNRK